MRIARVFPRKTKASPDDDLAFYGPLTRKLRESIEVDEVHVSVTFTYDTAKAEELYKSWHKLGVPVKVGGPAYGKAGGDFTPGLYLKLGNTITSRGCPNHCWFCSVHEREGGIRELPITDGWNIRDDNLLACSEEHIKKVFEMLRRQPVRAIFSGGIEPAVLRPWHADLIKSINAQSVYCAYDTPSDYEPLIRAGKIFRNAGIMPRSHILHAYVLVGYPGDTFAQAELRMIQVINEGFLPFAMLYRDETGETDLEWRKFAREWYSPMFVGSEVRRFWEPLGWVTPRKEK